MKTKILMVGQTPPPFGGQATIIQEILLGEYNSIEFFHVRMAFSKEMSEMGNFTISKVFILFSVIWNIYIAKIKYHPDILFYPPSGSKRIPLYRDIVILFFTRWMFKKTVFQFFAGGISDFIIHCNKIEYFFFKICFFYPELTLRPSIYSPDDGKSIYSKKDVIISWGNVDVYHHYKRSMNDVNIVKILFAALLIESKGIFILLEAFRLLLLESINVHLTILGSYGSEHIKEKLQDFITKNNMHEYVYFEGVKTGPDYYNYFADSDIFCFPSYFEAENLPVVVIDALQFALPIVATNWRGIPETIIDGENGYLVEIKNYEEIFRKLYILVTDKNKRRFMGNKGRNIYLQKFSHKKFLHAMEDNLKLI